jgi:hypothetical protein
MRPNPKFLTNNDFSGNKKCTPVGQVDRFQYGIVYEYPPYFIADNKFVPKEPILNLIADPDILFCRDKQLQKNIDQLWEKLSERLLEESGGTINLESSNIIFSIYGHWNMSADSRKKLESRQKLELERAIKKLK